MKYKNNTSIKNPFRTESKIGEVFIPYNSDGFEHYSNNPFRTTISEYFQKDFKRYKIIYTYLIANKNKKCNITIISPEEYKLEIKVNKPYYDCHSKIQELARDYIQELIDAKENKQRRIKRVEAMLQRTNQQSPQT